LAKSGFIGSIFGELTSLKFVQKSGYFLAYLMIYWFEDSLLRDMKPGRWVNIT